MTFLIPTPFSWLVVKPVIFSGKHITGLQAHLSVRRIVLVLGRQLGGVSFTRALKSCSELPACGSWELNYSLNMLAAA